MPDQRLARTRKSLPPEYQYGDAGKEWYELLRVKPHIFGTFIVGNMYAVMTDGQIQEIGELS